MLEIKNLTKKYDSKIAVDSLSLTIADSTIYGFIGHNGAGKSTTIKSITGILEFDEGDIIFNDLSVKTNPIEFKKEIAYIPDMPTVYQYMKGIQYINFVADIYDVSQTDRKERVEKYADLFELTKALGDYTSSYSHGMQQKLSLIAALVHEPKLLILDEPFVGLDPKSSYNLKEIMKNLCDEGKIVFFSTHILEVAEKLCTHIGIIENGKMKINGKTEDVLKDKTLEDIALEGVLKTGDGT